MARAVRAGGPRRARAGVAGGRQAGAAVRAERYRSARRVAARRASGQWEEQSAWEQTVQVKPRRRQQVTQAARCVALATLAWSRAAAAAGRAARRRAGGASVHAMAHGSWRCGQVLGRARAEGAGGAVGGARASGLAGAGAGPGGASTRGGAWE
jgi:hypothetical protein